MDRLTQVQAGITRLGTWIDEPNAGKDPLLQLVFRVGKVTEESGEAWDALIGVTGQNPRKGIYKTWDDVDKELLDTIVAAWGALEHRHGNRGVVADMLPPFVAGLLHRAGLGPIGGPAVEEGDRVRVLEWDNRCANDEDAPTPHLGEVLHVGSKKFAGQPSVGGGCFAARWESA